MSVRYNREKIPFRIVSETPIQGIIKVPGGKTHYFKTSNESYGNCVYTVDLPWSTEDYFVIFAGASAATEARYSLGINTAPSQEFIGFRDFAIYEANNDEEHAYKIENRDSIMAYLHAGDIDYYRINLGNEVPVVKLVSDNNEGGDLSLKLRHDFASVNGSFATARTGGQTATARGSYGAGNPFGSKTIGSKPFHYYKTGSRGTMGNTNTTYLDLGTGAGTILKDAANGYTLSVYIRTDGDRSGNGSFVWTFSTTNAMGNSGAVYFPVNTGRNDHDTTLAGSAREKRLARNNMVTSGEWIHLAYTQNGRTEPDNAKLYLNGVEVRSGTIDILPADISGNLIFNTLGGSCYTGDYNLSETMFADFRIYDTALDAGQIIGLAGDLAALNSVTWP